MGPPTPQNEFNLSQWQLYVLHEQFFVYCMYCMSKTLAIVCTASAILWQPDENANAEA